MRKLVLSIAVAFLIFPLKALAAEKDCRLLQYASLDLSELGSGAFGAPVDIQDRRLTLLVDTGGAFSMIRSSLVDELGLPRRALTNVRYMDIFGERITEYTTVPSLKLGKLGGPNIDFLILPDEMADGLDGLLAPDILSKFEVELDFAARKLNLFSGDHCKGELVYWTDQPYGAIPIKYDDVGHLLTPVELDGKKLRGLVDTGATASSMNFKKARRLFGWKSNPPELTSIKSRINSVETTIYQYPFKSLSFADVAVRNPTILLGEDILERGPQILIGMSILQRLHLFISYKEKMLYVTPAEAKVSSVLGLPAVSFAGPSELKWPGATGP